MSPFMFFGIYAALGALAGIMLFVSLQPAIKKVTNIFSKRLFK